MVCIYCGSKTEVINSRQQARNNSTWRRRRCLTCHALVTTIEQVEYTKSWVVLGNKGEYRPFLRDKLFLSIYDSLRHRKTALSDSESITATVISKLAKDTKSAHIPREQIIRATCEILKRFDKVAVVHYKAYYDNDN
ncbi:MAG: NrdR family transcriptional regulator [Candidatus Saccharimonadales bacterium]